MIQRHNAKMGTEQRLTHTTLATQRTFTWVSALVQTVAHLRFAGCLTFTDSIDNEDEARTFWAMVGRYRCSSSAVWPHFLSPLADGLQTKTMLRLRSSLRIVAFGGSKAPASLILRTARTLGPGIPCMQLYGSTECPTGSKTSGALTSAAVAGIDAATGDTAPWWRLLESCGVPTAEMMVVDIENEEQEQDDGRDEYIFYLSSDENDDGKGLIRRRAKILGYVKPRPGGGTPLFALARGRKCADGSLFSSGVGELWVRSPQGKSTGYFANDVKTREVFVGAPSLALRAVEAESSEVLPTFPPSSSAFPGGGVGNAAPLVAEAQQLGIEREDELKRKLWYRTGDFAKVDALSLDGFPGVTPVLTISARTKEKICTFTADLVCKSLECDGES